MCSGKAAYAPNSSDASQSASVHVLSEPRTISSGVSPAHSRTAQPSFRRSPAYATSPGIQTSGNRDGDRMKGAHERVKRCDFFPHCRSHPHSNTHRVGAEIAKELEGSTLAGT